MTTAWILPDVCIADIRLRKALDEMIGFHLVLIL